MIKGWTSVAMGMIAAAITGALVLAAQGVVLSVASLVVLKGERAAEGLLYLAMLATPIAIGLAAAGFLIGLVVIGAPAWLTLHGLGHRKRRDAMLAGAALSSLTGGVLLLVWTDGGAGVSNAMAAALLFLIPGAAAGWALHRIAYRPA